jgi:hypothetical protein
MLGDVSGFSQAQMRDLAGNSFNAGLLASACCVLGLKFAVTITTLLFARTNFGWICCRNHTPLAACDSGVCCAVQLATFLTAPLGKAATLMLEHLRRKDEPAEPAPTVDDPDKCELNEDEACA